MLAKRPQVLTALADRGGCRRGCRACFEMPRVSLARRQRAG